MFVRDPGPGSPGSAASSPWPGARWTPWIERRTRPVLSDGSLAALRPVPGASAVHRAPAVVLASALAEDGWIPVEKGSAATRFPGVYAVGDVTSVGTAKAGAFAERAARAVADQRASPRSGASRSRPATTAPAPAGWQSSARTRWPAWTVATSSAVPGKAAGRVPRPVRPDRRREGRVRDLAPGPLVRPRGRLTAAITPTATNPRPATTLLPLGLRLDSWIPTLRPSTPRDTVGTSERKTSPSIRRRVQCQVVVTGGRPRHALQQADLAKEVAGRHRVQPAAGARRDDGRAIDEHVERVRGIALVDHGLSDRHPELTAVRRQAFEGEPWCAREQRQAREELDARLGYRCRRGLPPAEDEGDDPGRREHDATHHEGDPEPGHAHQDRREDRPGDDRHRGQRVHGPEGWA